MKINTLGQVTSLPPALGELLNIFFCNCTKVCGGKCGAKKLGYGVLKSYLNSDLEEDTDSLDILISSLEV